MKKESYPQSNSKKNFKQEKVNELREDLQILIEEYCQDLERKDVLHVILEHVISRAYDLKLLDKVIENAQ